MSAYLGPIVLSIAVLICAFFAHRTWRDPDNWHLDERTKEPDFHAWPQLGLLISGAVCAALFAYLSVGI